MPELDDEFPIVVGDTRYQKWSPATERETRTLHYLIKKSPKHKSHHPNKVVLTAPGKDLFGIFRVHQVQGPDGKFQYPMYYIQTNEGSKYKTGEIAKVLDEKPFENETPLET
ncbi:hypothetical protein RF11_09528 [Thelohanellus kitauei]|uniref:Uncharacterized protein n=1 Tax=Thelohanellus kitauei TaxID=669202 RepID=A0A0C2J228_THEKT|nr:hypothetical protein RF11_09528 [Thelohanellus kitauei]